MNIYSHENNFIMNEEYTEYYSIITNALSLNRKKLKRTNINYVYYEAHHILPKSIFPVYIKEKWNIVLLTPEEHIKCHKLLVNMTTEENKCKMIYAAWCMVSRKTGDRDITIVSNEDYGNFKRLWAEEMSKSNTGNICSNNTKSKISKANKGRKPSKLAIENSLKSRENYKHSDDIKQFIGECGKGNQNTKDMIWWVKGGIEIMSRDYPREGWVKGRIPHSEETRLKIAKTSAGRIRSEETKLSQSEKMKGYIWPDDFGKKISAGKKGKKTNQQEIMGRRYANLSDLEFVEYISTMKSLLAKNRATNLRNKWIEIILPN